MPERTKFGRHVRARISQPTVWPLTSGVWVLDRAFGRNELWIPSGNRHTRLAAIVRASEGLAESARRVQKAIR